MQRTRRLLLTWLGLAGLLGTLLGPATASADPLTAWTAGPGAILDNTYDGFIDVPKNGATVATGGFTVAGWFVDKTAQGWAGADDVQIWQGTMDGGGKMLAKALFAQSRPDVAAVSGVPYWAASGFGATVPAGALSAGNQTISVYAHTPGKGWWYKQVNVTVSTSAPAAASPAPSAPAAAAPIVVSGGAPPIVVIEKPTSGENIKTHDQYQAMGYALDRNALPTSANQGTGIDEVSVYVDADKSNGGIFMGDADLAFNDATAQSIYGPQFAAAGWRFNFKPTNLHAGSHTFFIYAHSALTGKEDLATQAFQIIEN